MPSEVIRTRKVLPKTLLPTVLRRLFFLSSGYMLRRKKVWVCPWQMEEKRTDVYKEMSLATGKTSKKFFCTIFFNLQKAFMPPINKEFSEVLSNHFNKSFILKIPHAIGLWSNVHFLAPNHFGWCNYFLGFFSFPLNCSLQFSAPQD